MSLSDINPQIDPGTNATQDDLNKTGASLQQNAASLQQTVASSKCLNPAIVPSSNRHSDASAAVNAVKNHPITQNITDGPVAQNVKKEAELTSNEFGGLANSRSGSRGTTATGQSLTNYHSFFYTLLSWEHPRATAITFAGTTVFIFACRYLPVLKWFFKMSYMVLGVVTIAEVAAKYIMGGSVTSSVRPRNYYKIPKETLEASLDDLEQLINFFVIEFQRIIFAENIPVTAAAFLSAFISYYLIKILPIWGLTLVSACVVYLGPLIYVQNKELIDSQLEHASTVIGQQTAQVRDITAQQAGNTLESIKSYTSDYTAKAGELIGSARQQIPIPAALGGDSTTTKTNGVKEADFPNPPKSEFPSAAEHTKPVVIVPTTDAPIAASSN